MLTSWHFCIKMVEIGIFFWETCALSITSVWLCHPNITPQIYSPWMPWTPVQNWTPNTGGFMLILLFHFQIEGVWHSPSAQPSLLVILATATIISIGIVIFSIIKTFGKAWETHPAHHSTLMIARWRHNSAQRILPFSKWRNFVVTDVINNNFCWFSSTDWKVTLWVGRHYVMVWHPTLSFFFPVLLYACIHPKTIE